MKVLARFNWFQLKSNILIMELRFSYNIDFLEKLQTASVV
jgi:hypothetical protein